MYILGISAFFHDSSVSLIRDGKIITAIQEERLTRIKHDSSFPLKSIIFTLKSNNLSLKEIDYFVFYEKPFLKFERLLETYLAFVPRGLRSFITSIPVWLKEKLFQKNLIISELKKIDKDFRDFKKIKFCEHHLSHLASAYYPSPFQNSLILTVDGVGEWVTTTIAIGHKNKIDIKKEILFPHSLGLLYSAITYYLGFKVNSGEYKIMGLAPYGKPVFKEFILKHLIFVRDDGSFTLNMKYFEFATGLKMTNDHFDALFKQKRRVPEKEKISEFHMNLASSIQAVTEEIILKITRFMHKKYKINNLCLAGGVALNCVANGKILNDKKFKNIWIQPASGDAGGSLGAALAYWHLELKKQKKNNFDIMQGSYLGTFYSNYQVNESLKKVGAIFKKIDDKKLFKLITDNLVKEKTVGWFQGKMEFGPRALGARSILADPRSEKMQKKLNLKTKFRESFRPFAPSILREDLNKFFKINVDSPYMLLVSEIDEKIKIFEKTNSSKFQGLDKINMKRSKIPAVTHVDFSARIQTVHSNTNPRYYKLIQEFKKRTGFPILINTSFNIRGEPIVSSPEDAFRCFMGNDLDLLVIENFVLFKKDQNKNLVKDYRNNFELD